jgi:hypothetical protein
VVFPPSSFLVFSFSPSRLGVPKVVLGFCTKSKSPVYIGIWFIFPMVYLLISYLSSLSLFHITPIRMRKKNADQDGIFLGSVLKIPVQVFHRPGRGLGHEKWARTLLC